MPVAAIQKELRRLRVADIAAYVAHGFVNVSIGDGQIEQAVEIGVEKNAAEAERVDGRQSDAGLDGDVLVGATRDGLIEADHFVIEIGDGDSGASGIFEISASDAHAGTGFSLSAESDSGFDADVLERAILQIAVELVGLRVVGD